MSFILDALKKSESERLRQDTPSIASIPERSQDGTPKRWIWVVAALVTVNLAVLAGFILWKDNTVAAVAVPSEVAVPIELPGQEGASATFSELVSEAKRGRPAELAAVESSELPSAAAAQQLAPATEAVADAPSADSLVVDANGTVNDGLETFNDLRAKGVLQLPDMHLDIHVFSGESADRFVFVNMSKYREKAVLSEGPTVKEIVAEGVVLVHGDTTFLLPRQ